jgi:peptidoglycan/xylan/chitin deacetylase (PgdA/CDA1 family)
MSWLAVLVLCTTAEAAPQATPDPMPAEVATAGSGSAAAPVLDVKNLATLTNDPILGKAHAISGEEMTGVVAFTFDDGPNPATSPAVIDALEKYDIPATFFIVTQRITGKHGEPSRAILARELTEGFTVGSHSVTHANLGHATGDELGKEIDASIKTLAIQANRPIGLFRPPYGSLSGAARMRVKRLGLTEVQWSVDTLDWKARDPDRERKKVLRMILEQKGGVVLMHDVKPLTAKIIPEVLDDLEAENCSRLATGKDPIVPVSIHYFLRDGKTPRPLPDAVVKRTEAYKAALPLRCAARPKPPATGSGSASGSGGPKPEARGPSHGSDL